MKHDVLFNFISPVTGRLCIPEDYILIGDRDGFSVPSPILIDLSHDVNYIFSTPFILSTESNYSNAQSLGNLSTGLLKNTVNNATGTLSAAIAGKDYVEVATPIANMQLALIQPELIQDGQDVAKLLSRVARLPADNMSNLNKDKIWKGGDDNIPIEVDFPKFSPTDATYIIKTPNVNLSEAQVLEELGIGMAKIVAGGEFAIAISGQDYATSEQLEEIRDQCQEYANSAKSSADSAKNSADYAKERAQEAENAADNARASAFAAESFSTDARASALSAAASSASASGFAGAAGASAAAAAISATAASASAALAADSAVEAKEYLDTLLSTELQLQGDITGSGLLSNPIVTTFTPNPRFTGKGYIKIPVGTIEERPSNSEKGMIRYNTEL